ncbi:MAG: hypothetical protein ACK568_12380 [Pseudanabaena sp.]
MIATHTHKTRSPFPHHQTAIAPPNTHKPDRLNSKIKQRSLSNTHKTRSPISQ